MFFRIDLEISIAGEFSYWHDQSLPTPLLDSLIHVRILDVFVWYCFSFNVFWLMFFKRWNIWNTRKQDKGCKIYPNYQLMKEISGMHSGTVFRVTNFAKMLLTPRICQENARVSIKPHLLELQWSGCATQVGIQSWTQPARMASGLKTGQRDKY